MSNLGRLAGSSFMQIFMSLHTWGEMPGGIVGRRPSRATCKYREEQGGSQNLIVMGERPIAHRRGLLYVGRAQPHANHPPTQVYTVVFSPSFQSPCWRGRQRVPPVSLVPTEALQNSTCLLSVCLCLQASSAELEGQDLSVQCPVLCPLLLLLSWPFSTS